MFDMFDLKVHSPAVPSDTKAKRRSYDGAFKARVVSELINGKGSLKELAEIYGRHPNQIKNWKAILLKEACHVPGDKRRVKAGPA